MSEPQPPYGPPAGYGWTKGEPDAASSVPPAGYGTPPAGYGPPAPGYGPPPPGSAPAPWAGAPYGPGQGGPQETSSRAIIALVCAIGSYFVLPFLAAIAALVIASSAGREIDASGGRLTGRGLVTAAKVLSWINIALCIAVFVLAFAAFGLLAVGSSTSP